MPQEKILNIAASDKPGIKSDSAVGNKAANLLNSMEKLLDEKVRPALLEHEGDVVITDFSDGILKVRLTGHCAGCPSARLTTEELIADTLMKELDCVKDVVLVNEVSPDILDFAKELLGLSPRVAEAL